MLCHHYDRGSKSSKLVSSLPNLDSNCILQTMMRLKIARLTLVLLCSGFNGSSFWRQRLTTLQLVPPMKNSDPLLRVYMSWHVEDLGNHLPRACPNIRIFMETEHRSKKNYVWHRACSLVLFQGSYTEGCMFAMARIPFLLWMKTLLEIIICGQLVQFSGQNIV